MSTTSTFLDIALPMVQLNFAVIPVQPKEKACTLPNWQNLATIDIKQLEEWNAENPDYNVGLVARAEVGAPCFLEFDIKGGMKKAGEEMGQEVPDTRVHRSGKGFAHWVFAHTERSIKLGNRQANLPEGGEWFSFRADNRYVVGPGSTHPNGNKYAVAKDMLYAPIPDWVCEFIEKHTASPRTQNDSFVETSGDFDFDDLMEFFSDIFTILTDGIPSDHWYVTNICPISGHRHEQSVRTGFYWDGSVLGWHCFAQGCPGSSMSIGDVIHLLNQEKGEPYRGEIWPHDDIDLDDPRFTVEEAEEEIANEAVIDEGTGDSNSTSQSALESPDLIAEFLSRPVPETKQAEEPLGLDFDPRALYGKLGILAESLNLPLGYIYPSLMTTASALGVKDADGHVRGNLYTVLLGPVGHGKTAVTEAARGTIFLPETCCTDTTPGSDRGLVKMCGTTGSSLLLLQDEFRSTMLKCNIQGSNMAQVFCQLWNFDHAGCSDKKGVEECVVKLSVLGNVACADPTEFSKIFGSSTVCGLADRFVYGYSSIPVKYRPMQIKKAIFEVKPCRVPNWVWDAKDAWASDITGRRRLTEIVLRVALIQSSFNGDEEITRGSFEAACRFGEWQERIRAVYRPGLAETKEAECFEAVYSALWEKLQKQCETDTHPKGSDSQKHLHFAQIVNSKSYYRRYGSTMVNRIKKSMADEGIIAVVKEDQYDKEGNPTAKPRSTPFVILKGRIK